MAKLFNRVRVEVEYPADTYTDITPTVPDLVFSKERKNGQQFHRTSLESELTLIKAAWAFISEIETDAHCAEVGIRVSCGLDVIYEGAIALKDGGFDFDSCLATISASTDDPYLCLERGLKQQINILPGDQTLKFYIGTLETESCTDTSIPLNPNPLTDCLTEMDGWVIYENNYTNITPNGSGATPPFTVDQETIWIRQTVDSVTEPPGEGWTNIGANTWVKEPIVLLDEENTTDPPPPESVWYTRYKLAFGNDASIDNGVRLDDLLEMFMDEIGCDLTIVSDFFGINPDATHPTNNAYTAALEKMQNLLIFQKSDVKRGDVSNNATVGKMTLEELFNFFAHGMKVFPSIVGGALRLEHISYYENKNVSLDLTVPAYSRWMKRKRKYEYINDDNPRFEKFAAMETTNNANFDGVPITYGVECASKDNDTVEHRLGRFVTDISSVITSPGSFSDDGFVVVNAIEFDGELYADSEFSALSIFEEMLNGHLSFPNLHNKYWRNYAYQSEGTINSNAVTFSSVRPNKKGIPITLPGWCCSDFLDFDPSTLLITGLGFGEVVKMTYSMRSGNVTFELAYGGSTTS